MIVFLKKYINLRFWILAFLLVGCSATFKILPAGSSGQTSSNIITASITSTNIGKNTIPSSDLTLPAARLKTAQPSQTLALTVTSFPTLTSTPTIVFEPTQIQAPANSKTPTVDPGQVPLQLLSPGPNSKVVSPIELIVHISPKFAGSTRIELIGEFGEELYRKTFRTFPNIGYYTRVDENISYEIKTASELARLQISTFDKFGRIQAINSVHLLLQKVGENEITAGESSQPRLLLDSLNDGENINSESLDIKGSYLPINEHPLILELINESGVVLGSKLIQVNNNVGEYQPISISIPYSVHEETGIRLVFHQSDDVMDGLMYLQSLPLVLGPKQ